MTAQVPPRSVSIHMQSSRFAESKVYPLLEKDVSSLGVLASNDAEQLPPKVVWERSATTFPPTADDNEK